MKMQIPQVFKNGENHISLWLKIVAVFITVGGIVFAAGMLKYEVKDHSKRLDKQEAKIEHVDVRLQREELGTAKHEEIDKQVLETLKDVKDELKKRRK